MNTIKDIVVLYFVIHPNPINEKGLVQIYFVVFLLLLINPWCCWRCWSQRCWTGLGSPCAFALKHYDALYLVLWQHYDTPYLEHSVAAFRAWDTPPFSCVRESAFGGMHHHGYHLKNLNCLKLPPCFEFWCCCHYNTEVWVTRGTRGSTLMGGFVWEDIGVTTTHAIIIE